MKIVQSDMKILRMKLGEAGSGAAHMAAVDSFKVNPFSSAWKHSLLSSLGENP